MSLHRHQVEVSGHLSHSRATGGAQRRARHEYRQACAGGNKRNQLRALKIFGAFSPVQKPNRPDACLVETPSSPWARARGGPGGSSELQREPGHSSAAPPSISGRTPRQHPHRDAHRLTDGNCVTRRLPLLSLSLKKSLESRRAARRRKMESPTHQSPRYALSNQLFSGADSNTGRECP